MDTRELRYFVAVAEELHFGRAARRLGIAQPPLSRAISQLERRLTTSLLRRDSHSVALTQAGEVLLREGRAALAAISAAEHRTRRAAELSSEQVSVLLASKVGASAELLSNLLRTAELEGVHVDVLLCGVREQERLLSHGRADVAIMHRPFDLVDGLEYEVLLTQGQAAILPARHPLTDRAHVSMDELTGMRDLPAARLPDPDGNYADGPGPMVNNHSQLLQLISLGRTHIVAPVSAQLRDDVVAVPVVDAPKVSTIIAWPAKNRTPGVSALVRVARQLNSTGLHDFPNPKSVEG